MRDLNEVLREKEADLLRVRHELESLQIVATLLSDEIPSDELTRKKGSSAEREKEPDAANDSQATGTDDLFSLMRPDSRPSFWNSLRRK